MFYGPRVTLNGGVRPSTLDGLVYMTPGLRRKEVCVIDDVEKG